MKNLAKKLSVGVLSLMLLSSNVKAQNPLSKEDSIILNNYAKGYDLNYNPIEFSSKKKEYRWLEEPGLYAAPFIFGTVFFNISYCNNNLSSNERPFLPKTTVPIFLVGAAITTAVYIISDKIIEDRKKKRRLEKKYLGY